ncbi:MAG: hypothetical protein OSJ58_13535 [Dysosmobacter sp.]|nr:hypothetical protein [Dysosmobacter sp.]
MPKPYKTITLRLNADEYAHLQAQAGATGLKMEPLLRQLIQAEIDALTGQRRELYPLRRAGTEGAEAEIDAINDRLRALRRELKLCARIENDAPTVRANVGADRSETHEKTDKSRPDRHPPSGGRVPADRGR